MSGGPPDHDGVFARYFPYLDACIQFVVEDAQVVSVSFPEQPDEDAETAHSLLERIDDYIVGTSSDDFDDVPVEIDGPADVQEVLNAVRSIPYGQAKTIEELLAAVPSLDPDDEDDRARVREILDANPTPLVIPDHRVRATPSGAPPRIEQRLRSLERIVA